MNPTPSLLLLATALAANLCSLVATANQPNVVIIYGDDVGFGDIGVNGSELIPTPHIDRLARGGLNFTDGHCTASTCTPSRFSLLTGIQAFRYGARVLPPDAPLIVPTDKITLPKVFQQAGYDTAVIGKWHLGLGEADHATDWNGDVKPGPIEVGFDYSFLLPSTNDRVPTVYVRNHRVVNLNPHDPLFVGRKPELVNRPGSTAYPDAVVNRGAMSYYESSHGHNHSVINGIGRIGYMAGGQSALWSDEDMADVFIDEVRAYLATPARQDRPFFLFFSSQDIHVPRTPHPRFRGTTTLGYRGDAMVQFDWSTGAILDALEQNGLADNTIIIFSSDNGPVYDDGYEDGTMVDRSSEEVDQGHDGSGIYRGGKYQIAEGGTRVPFVVSWPGMIEPGTSAALVNQIDLLASFAALLDVELGDDDAPDSRNALHTLMGHDPQGTEFMLEESFSLAIRQGDWKFAEPHRVPSWSKEAIADSGEALFDLSTDPAELDNVIADHPERAARLRTLIAEIREGRNMRTLD